MNAPHNVIHIRLEIRHQIRLAAQDDNIRPSEIDEYIKLHHAELQHSKQPRKIAAKAIKDQEREAWREKQLNAVATTTNTGGLLNGENDPRFHFLNFANAGKS